jgi:hypothetical protein
MNCKCRRPNCKHEWTTKGKEKPKSCPACKSYAWETSGPVRKTTISVKRLRLVCAKCKAKIPEGADIYYLNEGKVIDKRYRPGKKHGVYCEDCVAPEDQMPFSN